MSTTTEDDAAARLVALATTPQARARLGRTLRAALVELDGDEDVDTAISEAREALDHAAAHLDFLARRVTRRPRPT